MFQKILILILFALPTFAQSPFSKMEGFFDGTATTPSTPDITTDLVALWQDGDTVDVTGRGNDLTRSHTDPVGDPPAQTWDEFTTYTTGNLILLDEVIYRSLIDENTGNSPPSSPSAWTRHAPYKTATGLAGIDSAVQFNGIDHYLSRASTTDLQLGGTDFTIAVWVKTPVEGFVDILSKGNEYNIECSDEAYYQMGFGSLYTYFEGSTTGNYDHIVMVQSGSTASLVLNGASFSNSGNPISITNNTNAFSIGKLSNWAYLNGQIAQLAIYKRALTQEQIAYLYNGGDGRLIDVISTPRNIAAVGDTNKITLTWTDPSQSDFDSVRVYAGTTANPTTWVASVAKGVQSYVDTNYSYNTIRHYRLKALTTSGDTSNYTSSVNDTVMIWLGSELVTNGTFDVDANWTKNGSTISGGKANIISVDGTLSLIYQSVACTSGYTYRCTFDVVRTSGTLIAYYNVEGNVTLSNTIATSGSYSYSFTAATTGSSLAFKRLWICDINIDNVSLKRILNP